MNLYRISWGGSIVIPNFYSPQFLEAPNELEALSEFVSLFKSVATKVSPKDIKIEEICVIDKIRKYENIS